MADTDKLVMDLMSNMPESWDGEDSADSICVVYVRTLEARLLALGGTCEKCSEDQDGAPLPDALTDPSGYCRAVLL